MATTLNAEDEIHLIPYCDHWSQSSKDAEGNPVAKNCLLVMAKSQGKTTDNANANQRSPHMSVLNSVSQAIQKRVAYLRTKSELEAMPLNVALDLDIYRGDAAKIASKAVYG